MKQEIQPGPAFCFIRALSCCIYCCGTHTRTVSVRVSTPKPRPFFTVVIPIARRDPTSHDRTHNILTAVHYVGCHKLHHACPQGLLLLASLEPLLCVYHAVYYTTDENIITVLYSYQKTNDAYISGQNGTHIDYLLTSSVKSQQYKGGKGRPDRAP